MITIENMFSVFPYVVVYDGVFVFDFKFCEFEFSPSYLNWRKLITNDIIFKNNHKI
jgi:hypothetical protein